RKKEQEPVEGNPNPSDGPKKPISFEDLLNEIRHEQGEPRQEAESVEDVWDDGHYDEDDNQEEAEVLKEASYEKPYAERARYYEGSWESKNRYESQPLVKLDDQVDLDSTETLLGEVEEGDDFDKGNNRFGRLLKNPETLRDAVVVSEILTRK